MVVKPLFLFVIAANALFLCFCAPECTMNEERMCSAGKDNDWQGTNWPRNEDELNKACSGDMISSLDCYIEFGERCPNSISAKFLKSSRESKELYNKLCSTGDSLREQFLRNVECLNNNAITISEECAPETQDGADKKCIYDEGILSCIKSKVTEKCGTEAANVFTELMKHLISLSEAVCNNIGQKISFH